MAIVLRRKPFRLWPMVGLWKAWTTTRPKTMSQGKSSAIQSFRLLLLRRRVLKVQHDNEVAQLKQRIAELESAAANRTRMVAGSAALKASRKAGQLFAPMQGAAQSSLTAAADWSKLQMLAGSPPPRVGVGEKRRGRVPDTVRELEGAFANLEKEAEDPDEVPDLLAVLKEESTDPVHKLLAVQLRQNQALLEKLVGQKHSDPVLGALTGGETSSGSSSCLAHDAFITRRCRTCPKSSE